eukprot:m.115575 g.115575  ORF g.115575 m.115575 type:complete len:282 (+) comp17146_c0_seq2:195-1040(+)
MSSLLSLYRFTKRIVSCNGIRDATSARACHSALAGKGHCFGNTHGRGILAIRRIPSPCKRFVSMRSEAEYIKARQKRNKNVLYYVGAVGILCVGFSYAAVPLYRMFCQASGFGGTVMQDIDPEHIANMEKVEDRVLKINFNADTGATMQWSFKPQQREVYVAPGETALAFYSATNPTDEPVIGISAYNVIPYEAGQYFSKIQCFCFEEQMLNPHEQVDMPVFFYIDPEFANDPNMAKVTEITLSYTFFKARDVDGNALAMHDLDAQRALEYAEATKTATAT